MISDKDRRHADLAADFFSQLAVAFVAGAFLQIILPDLAAPGRVGFTLMTGLFLYAAAHAILELTYRTSP